MAKLGVFNLITLDGYFKGRHGDISWHNYGKDEQDFSDQQSNRGGTLIFGRVTYEMMFSYWSSEQAFKNDPITAKGMNGARKIVFSRSLKEPKWQNTTAINGDLIEEIRKLKATNETDMTILGSGQIVAQLSEAGLIDKYLLMLNPLALGDGTTLFKGLSHQLKLRFVSARPMKSGNVLLNYEK